MCTNRKSATSPALFMRLPEAMNLRIDTAVYHRRCQTGERVSRAALLLEILDDALPPLPDAYQTKVEA